MGRIVAKGVVASTHPMTVYGGIRLSEQAVRSIAEKLRSDGAVTFGMHHDRRLTLDAVVTDVIVRTDDSGETIVEATFDVDEDEYAEKGGELVGGFSVTCVEAFLPSEYREPAVTLAADAGWYSDADLQRFYEFFASHGIPAQAGRLYQFSAASDAVVLLSFVGQQVATMPTGIICNYIYDSLKLFVSGCRDSGQSDLEINFDPKTGRAVTLHLRTSSDEALKAAVDKLPAIIESNSGKSYEYSDDAQEWKQIN